VKLASTLSLVLTIAAIAGCSSPPPRTYSASDERPKCTEDARWWEAKATREIFLSGEYRSVVVFYTAFESVVRYVPTAVQLLPVEKPAIEPGYSSVTRENAATAASHRDWASAACPRR